MATQRKLSIVVSIAYILERSNPQSFSESYLTDENFEEKLEFTLKPAFAVPNQTFPALSSINVVILFPGIEAWSVSSCKRLT